MSIAIDADQLEKLADAARAKVLCAQLAASTDAAAMLELLQIQTRMFRRFNDTADPEDVLRNQGALSALAQCRKMIILGGKPVEEQQKRDGGGAGY